MKIEIEQADLEKLNAEIMNALKLLTTKSATYQEILGIGFKSVVVFVNTVLERARSKENAKSDADDQKLLDDVIDSSGSDEKTNSKNKKKAKTDE